MEKNKIKAILLEILTNYAKDKEALANATDETEIRADLKIKSARLVDVILDVESELNIEVEPDDMDQMFTIGEAVDILNNYLSK